MPKHARSETDVPQTTHPEIRALSEEISQLRELLFDDAERATRDQERRPLPGHLKEWRAFLVAKGDTEKHVEHMHREARLIIRLCKAAVWRDLTAPGIQAALSKLCQPRVIVKQRGKQRVRKTKGAGTANHYRAAIRAFCGWMTRTYRARRNPTLEIKSFNAAADPRHPRRAYTHAEFLQVVTAATNGEIYADIPGFERAMSYLQAATTGVRSKELQGLTRDSFRLDDRPTVTIHAAYSKNGETQSVELSPEIAEMLRAYFHQIDAGRETNLFRRPKSNAMRGLKHDLKVAGIPYKTNEGYADFHALRHTFITNLFEHGATPPQAQQMARHKTAAMTARYGHSTEEGRREVLKRFPAPPTINFPRTDAGTSQEPAQPGRMD